MGCIHLVKAGKLSIIAFDKTCTFTEGKPEVSDVIPLADLNEREILGISKAMESFSQHPLATAIIRKAEVEQVTDYQAENFQSITGKGATASVQDTAYFIGNPRLFEEMLSIPEDRKSVA